MVLILAVAGLGVGAVLILLIAAATRAPRRKVEAGAMPAEEFRALVLDLLDALGLRVTYVDGGPACLEIVAHSRDPLAGGKLLVHAVAVAENDLVDAAQVLRLHEAARADGALKGVLLSPWPIAADGVAHQETPLELIDGRALRALVAERLPDRLPSLDACRGFGA